MHLSIQYLLTYLPTNLPTYVSLHHGSRVCNLFCVNGFDARITGERESIKRKARTRRRRRLRALRLLIHLAVDSLFNCGALPRRF